MTSPDSIVPGRSTAPPVTRKRLRRDWSAGMHAAALVLGREAALLDRTNSYMAVMIDDLTLHGVSEPYRMLTARAEYRLRLRANNATTRLTPLAMAAGCVGERRAEWFARREEASARLDTELDKPVPAGELAAAGLPVRVDAGRLPLREWLRFGGVDLPGLHPWIAAHALTEQDLAEEVAEDAAYAPYLARQESELRELKASEALPLGDDFPYGEIPGLSREMVERLDKSQPDNIGCGRTGSRNYAGGAGGAAGPCTTACGMIDSEEAARAWLQQLPECDDAAMERLEQLVALLVEENERQNLVSAASLSEVWRRHIVDSAQLLTHVSRETSSPWLDLGTGAGFPGLVIAALRPQCEVIMVESRARRIEWLERVRVALGLERAKVCGMRMEQVETREVCVISARAFAPLDRLLALSARFSTKDTVWLLPKGRSAQHELDELRGWQHMFHVEQSVTEPQAGIIVGTLAGRKGKRS